MRGLLVASWVIGIAGQLIPWAAVAVSEILNLSSIESCRPSLPQVIHAHQFVRLQQCPRHKLDSQHFCLVSSLWFGTGVISLSAILDMRSSTAG